RGPGHPSYCGFPLAPSGCALTFILQPWQLLLLIVAGWINRQQQQIIDYLRTENQVLKEKLGKRRILLSDDHRRSLAVKAKVLGRKVLSEVGTLVTPDTLLRWTASSWPRSGTIVSVGSRTPAVPSLPKRSMSWWCAWRGRTRAGAMIA